MGAITGSLAELGEHLAPQVYAGSSGGSRVKLPHQLAAHALPSHPSHRRTVAPRRVCPWRGCSTGCARASASSSSRRSAASAPTTHVSRLPASAATSTQLTAASTPPPPRLHTAPYPDLASRQPSRPRVASRLASPVRRRRLTLRPTCPAAPLIRPTRCPRRRLPHRDGLPLRELLPPLRRRPDRGRAAAAPRDRGQHRARPHALDRRRVRRHRARLRRRVEHLRPHQARRRLLIGAPPHRSSRPWEGGGDRGVVRGERAGSGGGRARAGGGGRARATARLRGRW